MLEKRPKHLYPVEIPLQHYQLRHFISTEEDGRIYYTAREDVVALHLATGKRQRLASLPFLAQCLGAGFGWVGVGGQNGCCVFVDVRERSAGVDELLPLNLNIHARPGDEPQDIGLYHPIRPRKHVHDVSTDYINAITIFRIASEEKGIDDEEVALVATNDRSVEIFSLRQMKVIATLCFAVHMNHASISPDGKLMIACGDSPRAYFLRRVRRPGHVHDGDGVYAKYEWEEIASVRLQATEPGDTCFSTAFSPSGHICTIASQFGVVAVFDVSRIVEGMGDDDAVIDAFTSSRPAAVEEVTRSMPGAIRSTAFSPGPWDLFAWAEDHGRVCIADLRDGFRTRHLIELNPHSHGISRFEISAVEDHSITELHELDLERSFLRRQRNLQAASEQLASLQSNADYIENAAERRRRSRELANTFGTISSASSDLNEMERQILQTLRVERLQDFVSSASDDALPSNAQTAGSSTFPSRGYNPNVSVRQYMRERIAANRDLQSSSTRTHTPRRRSSVVMSSSRNAEDASSTPYNPSSATAPAPNSSLLSISGTNTLSTSPSRIAGGTSMQASARSSDLSSPEPPSSTSTGTSEQAWRTISAAMTDATQPSPPSPTASNRLGRVRDTIRSLNYEDPPASEAFRRIQHRQLEEARSQIQAFSNATSDRENDSNFASRAEARMDANNGVGLEGDDPVTRAAQNAQRERTRRQQVQQLLGDEHALQRQGAEGQESLAQAQRGLDRVHSQQVRRLQERAQVAEERFPGIVSTQRTEAGAASGIAYLREAGELAGFSLGFRREREHGIAIMGLGWSNDGRSL